jgi:hypothetical protein
MITFTRILSLPQMVQVYVFPPHCQLKRVMQVFYCAVAADKYAPPNHGADAK